jgi:alkylhydroperoxidase family enzyme
MIGAKAGLSRPEILAVRKGRTSGNARIDALTTFTQTVVGTSGTVPADVVAAVQAAGYTDAQIVDTLLAIASITFTNLVNRVNDTVLDFPVAD